MTPIQEKYIVLTHLFAILLAILVTSAVHWLWAGIVSLPLALLVVRTFYEKVE